MKTKKIKDCLPLVNGIWSKINYPFPEIFDVDSSQLDIMFLSNWSMRTAAPILNVIHTDETTSMLTQEELTQLAGIINGMYKHKWDKLMAVAEMEYDPIHNFSDHLEETVSYTEGVEGSKSGTASNSETRTDNLSSQSTDLRTKTDTFNTTDTETDNKTITETHNMSNTGSNSNQDNIYGFNSSTAVGEGNSSGNNSNLESGTITDAHTGTIANAKTGTVQTANGGTLTELNTGTQTNAGSSSNSETSSNDTEGERTREYTKTGNIGNISTQKLMKEEIELWKYNFIHEIMRDVANFVSLPIYEL